jgi:hypothetical protein
MFEELTEPQRSGWRRLHWTRNVALLTLLSAAAFTLPAYNCAQRTQIERDGVQTTAIINRVSRHRTWRYTWNYSFEAEGRRFYGSWKGTVASLGPQAGDSIVITYLRSDPSINHHGSPHNQEIDGSDIELLVLGLGLAVSAFYAAMGN